MKKITVTAEPEPMSAEEEFFRVEYNNRLDNDGDECVVPTVWFGSQGFDLVRQYDQGEQSALEHAKWYVSMFEKAMESYAREYHTKEMQNRLEDMLEEMCGVLPEYHREIVEDELNHLKEQKQDKG